MNAISIITVSFNSVSTIEDTMRSVLAQDYKNIEYLIIDGGSNDKTLDIIKKYQRTEISNLQFLHSISKVVSEKDKGLYDAMNKGIKMASGEIIGILNSDDFYCDSRVISDVMKCFKNPNVDACYADIVYVGRENTNKITRYWKAGDYLSKKLKHGWIPPHPGFFARRELYERFGLYNLVFPIAADYELMLRFFLRGMRTRYLKRSVVRMREGGNSAGSLRQRIKGWKEIQKAWRVNGLKPSKMLFLTRPLFKIHQYLFKNPKT